MRRYLLFFLCLYATISAHANAGYGIDVSLQSPLTEETDAGTIITASFLVINRSEKEESFNISLTLPPGWVLIPFEEPFFTLKSQETRVQLIAIRVPPNALAGMYSIDYKVQGREHPSLIGTSTFSVSVLAKSSIQASIEKEPKYGVAGDLYFVEIEVINTGNIENDVTIQIKNYQDCEITTDKDLLMHLAPGQIERLSIAVKTKDFLANPTKHFLYISLEPKENPSNTCHLASEVEIFPKQQPALDSYDRLPMKTVFGYGMKNKKKQLFIEQYGSGPLDEAKKKT